MKNSIEQNLNSMGFSLPKKIKAAGSYVPFLKEGNFLFISGQLPIKNNKVLFSGKIDNKNKDYGYKAAQLCALNIIGLINIVMKGNFSKKELVPKTDLPLNVIALDKKQKEDLQRLKQFQSINSEIFTDVVLDLERFKTIFVFEISFVNSSSGIPRICSS